MNVKPNPNADQARRDMINYWQGTPIIDRTTSTPIAPVKPQSVQRVMLNDLPDFCERNGARVDGRVNDWSAWPRVELAVESDNGN